MTITKQHTTQTRTQTEFKKYKINGKKREERMDICDLQKMNWKVVGNEKKKFNKNQKKKKNTKFSQRSPTRATSIY